MGKDKPTAKKAPAAPKEPTQAPPAATPLASAVDAPPAPSPEASPPAEPELEERTAPEAFAAAWRDVDQHFAALVGAYRAGDTDNVHRAGGELVAATQRVVASLLSPEV